MGVFFLAAGSDLSKETAIISALPTWVSGVCKTWDNPIDNLKDTVYHKKELIYFINHEDTMKLFVSYTHLSLKGSAAAPVACPWLV